MGDLVWERILFLNLWRQNFFPDIQQCKIFFTHYTPREIFFSVQENFFPDISLQDCFPSKSVCRISFFLKLPVTSPAKKSQMVGRSAPYYKLQKLLILVETVNFSVFVSNNKIFIPTLIRLCQPACCKHDCKKRREKSQI